MSKVGQPMSNSWSTSSRPDFVHSLARRKTARNRQARFCTQSCSKVGQLLVNSLPTPHPMGSCRGLPCSSPLATPDECPFQSSWHTPKLAFFFQIFKMSQASPHSMWDCVLVEYPQLWVWPQLTLEGPPPPPALGPLPPTPDWAALSRTPRALQKEPRGVGGRGRERAGREGLWLEGRVLQLQWGMGGGTLQTPVGARPTSGGSQAGWGGEPRRAEVSLHHTSDSVGVERAV